MDIVDVAVAVIVLAVGRDLVSVAPELAAVGEQRGVDATIPDGNVYGYRVSACGERKLARLPDVVLFHAVGGNRLGEHAVHRRRGRHELLQREPGADQ